MRQGGGHSILSVIIRNLHISLGAKCFFFEELLHPLSRKLFLHLKEAILHLQRENVCRTCQFLVAFEI